MAENNCVICFKNVHIYSVGECDHPVCYECSTRMRVLCRQNECPICRHELSVVIFTEKVRPFRRLKRRYALYDTQHHIAFDNLPIEEMYEILLQHSCNKCHKHPVFDSFEMLNEHMRKAHDLYCCDLCAENLKIFSSEMRYYTKMDLNRHRRIGDVDDRSHRGHPLCEFCDVRFMDRDELYRHLRKIHLFCHICDSEGIQQFYGQYDTLRDHYRKDHFLCEEGDCIQETLTSVFPTEIDLKAHKALVHCKNLRNKQAVKQARTLELEFHLAPRSRRPTHHEHHENISTGQNAQPSDNNLHKNMASWEQEFPSLTNEALYTAPRPKIIRERNNRLAFDEQNFPSLGSEANIRLNIVESRPSSSSSTSTSVTSANISVQMKSKKTNDKRRDGPILSIAGPSTSTLSLTWVKNAKEKKQPSGKISPTVPNPRESVPKPPTLTREDFPKLQMGCVTGEVKESPKKNKKSSVAIHIDESNQDRVSLKNSDVSCVTKQRKAASSDVKPASDSPITKNDDKTACFLLNASRKKVKMKSETCMPPNVNSSQSSSNSLPKSASLSQVPSGSGQSKAKRDNADSANRSTNYFNRNCDTIILDGKIKKSKSNEKSNKQMPKDVEKKGSSKGKENVSTNVKTEEKKHSQSTNNSNNNNVPKKERTHNQDSRQKSKVEETKGEGMRKKTELNIGLLSSSQSSNHVGTPKEQAINKPPPGLDKPKLPVPPPGIQPIEESNAATLASSISDPMFVYQQPNNFASRNSELIKKITASLHDHSDEALNELKTTSLLFREGLLPAVTFYRYCKEKFKNGDFDDIFTELIVLLPNIPKQQELVAIHVTSSPVNSFLSRIHTCQVCFQILQVDDMLYHYSQHSINTDPSLLCVGDSN